MKPEFLLSLFSPFYWSLIELVTSCLLISLVLNLMTRSGSHGYMTQRVSTKRRKKINKLILENLQDPTRHKKFNHFSFSEPKTEPDMRAAPDDVRSRRAPDSGASRAPSSHRNWAHRSPSRTYSTRARQRSLFHLSGCALGWTRPSSWRSRFLLRRRTRGSPHRAYHRHQRL